MTTETFDRRSSAVNLGGFLILILAVSGCGKPESLPVNPQSSPTGTPNPVAREIPKIAVPKPSEILTVEEAIELAERFIKENGYTEYTPPSAAGLISESIERFDRSRWIARRHDTLRSRACGFIRGGPDNDYDWIVGFRYREPEEQNHGRGVEIQNNPRRVRIIHSDLKLQRLEPLVQ